MYSTLLYCTSFVFGQAIKAYFVVPKMAKVCTKDSKALEITVFVFAVSFIFAAFYYLPHAFDTAAAWILTSFAAFGAAFLIRVQRLDTAAEYSVIKDVNTLRVAQFAVIFFLGWAVLNMVIAITEQDGIEPESRWMTFIATAMGLKWSGLLLRSLSNIQASLQNQSRRALLSPIGEIA